MKQKKRVGLNWNRERERERVSLGCKLERKLHKVHQPPERNLSQIQIQMKYELDPLVFGDIELLFVLKRRRMDVKM